MEIILLVYLIWAVYSGWKFMDGKVAFLEREGLVYIVLKILCSGSIGLIYGIIYLVKIICHLFNL